MENKNISSPSLFSSYRTGKILLFINIILLILSQFSIWNTGLTLAQFAQREETLLFYIYDFSPLIFAASHSLILLTMKTSKKGEKLTYRSYLILLFITLNFEFLFLYQMILKMTTFLWYSIGVYIFMAALATHLFAFIYLINR